MCQGDTPLPPSWLDSRPPLIYALQACGTLGQKMSEPETIKKRGRPKGTTKAAKKAAARRAKELAASERLFGAEVVALYSLPPPDPEDLPPERESFPRAPVPSTEPPNRTEPESVRLPAPVPIHEYAKERRRADYLLNKARGVVRRGLASEDIGTALRAVPLLKDLEAAATAKVARHRASIEIEIKEQELLLKQAQTRKALAEADLIEATIAANKSKAEEALVFPQYDPLAPPTIDERATGAPQAPTVDAEETPQ